MDLSIRLLLISPLGFFCAGRRITWSHASSIALLKGTLGSNIPQASLMIRCVVKAPKSAEPSYAREPLFVAEHMAHSIGAAPS